MNRVLLSFIILILMTSVHAQVSSFKFKGRYILDAKSASAFVDVVKELEQNEAITVLSENLCYIGYPMSAVNLLNKVLNIDLNSRIMVGYDTDEYEDGPFPLLIQDEELRKLFFVTVDSCFR